jgi:4-hydroxymandelate oxidase
MLQSPCLPPTDLLTLKDYEAAAQQRLPKPVYDYYAGGAADEITVRENEAAWRALHLRPRVLVDVSAVDLRTTVLGQPIALPLLTAPCALNALAHPEGELAVARATAQAGIGQILSTVSAYSVEEVAAASGGLRWLQLYCYRDRGLTRDLVQRAEAAGFRALCLTVDVPVPGLRERDLRNRFRVPAHIRVANFDHLLSDFPDGSSLLKYVSDQFDPSLTWASLDWLRSFTTLPIVVKGVLTAEDARRAVECGLAGVVVSNHGGRQLDSVIPTAHALPEVVEAVAGRAEVFVDGGVRRGTDILKALALGARAVLIGRPYLWGLAVAGEAGVRHVFQLLSDDLRLSLALAGCPSVGAVSPGLLAGR